VRPLRKVFAQGAVAQELGGRLCIDNLSVRLTRSEVTSICRLSLTFDV